MRQFNRKWTLDREKFLSEAEVKKLRRTIEDKALADLQKGRTTWPRFWMAIDLAASAGLRVSEIANLKIDNLYLHTREPRIRVTGKGNRTRDVFISRDLMKHLSAFWNGNGRWKNPPTQILSCWCPVTGNPIQREPCSMRSKSQWLNRVCRFITPSILSGTVTVPICISAQRTCGWFKSSSGIHP
jgi:integrase